MELPCYRPDPSITDMLKLEMKLINGAQPLLWEAAGTVGADTLDITQVVQSGQQQAKTFNLKGPHGEAAGFVDVKLEFIELLDKNIEEGNQGFKAPGVFRVFVLEGTGLKSVERNQVHPVVFLVVVLWGKVE